MNIANENVMSFISQFINKSDIPLHISGEKVELEGRIGKQYVWHGLIPNDIELSKVLPFEDNWLFFGGFRSKGYGYLSGYKDVEYVVDNDGIYSLLFKYGYYGTISDRFEVSQEFSYLFNLYIDGSNYFAVDMVGDKTKVVTNINDKIFFKRKYLSRYANLKKSKFIHCFSYDFAEKINIPAHEYRDSNIGYFVDHFDLETIKSRIEGWVVVEMEYNEPIEDLFAKGDFEDFIVGEDKYGEAIMFTCNPDKVESLYFSKNRNLLAYDLTPVFFKSEVLNKYRSDDRYSISGTNLTLGSLWSLRMDNYNDKYVVALLCDLSSLPHNEQLHWKSSNITKKDEMGFSKVIYNSWFLGTWTDGDSDSVVFNFLDYIVKLNNIWVEKFGWKLFLELREEDMYHYKQLRIHEAMNQSDFDTVVGSLSMILIEYMNVSEIKKSISDMPEGITGSINIFYHLLKEMVHKEYDTHIKTLYNFRNATSGHRKSSKFDKLLMNYGTTVLEDILEQLMNEITVFLKELLNDIE